MLPSQSPPATPARSPQAGASQLTSGPRAALADDAPPAAAHPGGPAGSLHRRWYAQLGDAVIAATTGQRPAALRAMTSTSAMAEFLSALPPRTQPERVRRVLARAAGAEDSAREVVVLLEGKSQGWAVVARVEARRGKFVATSLRVL